MKHKLFYRRKIGIEELVSRVVNPYDGSFVGEVFQAGPAEMEHAIMPQTKDLKSHASFHLTVGHKFSGKADQLRSRKEEIARTMTLESGKPIQYTRSEVDRAVLTFYVAAEEASEFPAKSFHLILPQVPRIAGEL